MATRTFGAAGRRFWRGALHATDIDAVTVAPCRTGIEVANTDTAGSGNPLWVSVNGPDPAVDGDFESVDSGNVGYFNGSTEASNVVKIVGSDGLTYKVNVR